MTHVSETMPMRDERASGCASLARQHGCLRLVRSYNAIRHVLPSCVLCFSHMARDMVSRAPGTALPSIPLLFIVLAHECNVVRRAQ
jgi:hypothetical protein